MRHPRRQSGPAHSAWRVPVSLVLVLALAAPSSAGPLGTPLEPDYRNPNDSNGVVSFGGHVSGDSPANNDGSVTITSSGIGQPLSRGKAIANFGMVLRDRANQLLFYQPGAPVEQNERAAFRYRQSLFGVNEFGQPQNVLASNDAPPAQRVEDRIAMLEDRRDALLDELYGPDEQAQVVQALELVRKALQYDPTDSDFQNLWLDIVYYQVEIGLIKAKEKIVRGFRQNIFPTDPLLPIVTNEVNLFEDSLEILNGALAPYFEFLRGEILGESLGIEVDDYFRGLPNAADNPTYGLFVFRDLVPRRSATSGSLMTRDGGTLPVRPGEGEGNVVSPAGRVLDKGGQTVEFAVLTNTTATTWSASAIAPWVTLVDAIERTGNGTFSVEVDKNNGADFRQAVVDITFSDGENSPVFVSIHQDQPGEPGGGLLSVTPRTLTLSPEGGVVTLDVDAEGLVPWAASVAVGDDWLRIDAGSEQGVDDGAITLAYPENAGPAGRFAAVRVSAFDQEGRAMGIPVTVEATQPPPQDVSVLYAGFKDYVLVFEVLKEQARAASELIHRYALRGGRADLVAAKEVVRRVLGPRAAEGDLLTTILDWRSNSSGATGAARDRLYGAYNGLHTARQALLTKDQFLKGNRNLLGFDPDFLMLVQRFQRVDGDIFDSFDSLVAYNYDSPSDVSPLKFAVKKLDHARASFFSYRQTLDTLKEQFRVQNLAVRDRLRTLTGVDPGQDIDNPPFEYRDFENNPNGELALQMGNIRLAETHMQFLNNDTNVLKVQIANETAIRDRERMISQDIRGIVTDYGQFRGDLERRIGRSEGVVMRWGNVAEGTQAALDIAMSALTSDLFTVGGNIVIGAISAAAIGGIYGVAGEIQLAQGIKQGDLRAQMEEYAAAENAEVIAKEAQLQQFIRSRTIEELNAQMRVGDMEWLEAQQVRRQEQGRRLLLLTEKQALEQRMRENNEGLVDRLFADPIYRMMYMADAAEAQRAFEEAQKWAFFMVRALEYKWNTPFFYSYGGKEFSQQSVFSARNAEELEELAAAMISYDGLLQASGRGDVHRDTISFVEDILGLDRLDLDGNLVFYDDPLDPTGPQIDGAGLFLRYLQDKVRSSESGEDDYIELHFSTAKAMADSFYRGAKYDENGELIDRGLYLDKIVSLQVNLIGSPPPGAPDAVPGVLTYGGSSFIRNQYVGEQRAPDRIAGEFTIYPTRFWYYDPGHPDLGIDQGWKSRNGQQASVVLNLAGPEGVAEDTNLITVFKERSVATSDWGLIIYTRNDLGETILDPDWLDDIQFEFVHTAKDRP